MESALSTLVTTITTVFTAGMGWVGQVASTVVEQPLFLVPIVVGFIGTGIAYFKSLAH